jgi:hypothetical protein
MAERLGWPLEGFREAFREVSGQAFQRGCVKPLVRADWKAHLVWVPKAIKYNMPQSPNVIRSWAGAWDELPECPLKVEAHQTLEGYLEGYSKAFGKAFADACRSPSGKASAKLSEKPSSNQEQEQEQEQEQDKKNEDSPLPPAVNGMPITKATAHWVIERWNAIPGVEPLQLKYYNPHAGVGKKLATRLSERKSKAWWDGFFARVRESSWLVEEFHPCLDWALGPQNMQKILQGNYVKTVKSKPKTAFGQILHELSAGGTESQVAMTEGGQ